MPSPLENRLATRSPVAQHALARWRTRRFDRIVAQAIERQRPGAALVFSDVGTEHALPACRKLGIPSVLSMVHGDVREEREVLEREAAEAPDFFPLYLGDGKLDREELDWLHERRLRDIELADRILVPSEHIAETLAEARDALASGSPSSLTRPIPDASSPAPESVTTRLYVPVRGGDHPAEGDQVPPRSLAAWSAGPAGSSNSSGPCRRDLGPLDGVPRTRSSTSAGSPMPRCRRGWPRPTSSSSPRCSRGRPSSPTRPWPAACRAW